MKRAVVFLLSSVVLLSSMACGSKKPGDTSSARAAYGVYPEHRYVPAKRMKKNNSAKKSKKLKYSNGKGGTMSAKPNSKKKNAS